MSRTWYPKNDISLYLYSKRDVYTYLLKCLLCLSLSGSKEWHRYIKAFLKKPEDIDFPEECGRFAKTRKGFLKILSKNISDSQAYKEWRITSEYQQNKKEFKKYLEKEYVESKPR